MISKLRALFGKPRVFISYRRVDAPGHAGRLHDRLVRRFGITNVFIDVEAIDPGRDFKRAIIDAVVSCDVFLAVIGRSWLHARGDSPNSPLESPDDFVRIEILSAMQHGIHIVPVLIGGSRLPRASELPRELASLVQRQAFDVPDQYFHEAMNRLIRHIERLSRTGKRGLKPAVEGVLELAPLETLTGDVKPENEALQKKGRRRFRLGARFGGHAGCFKRKFCRQSTTPSIPHSGGFPRVKSSYL